jgi:hypothetical protein
MKFILYIFKVYIPIPSGEAFRASIAASPPELPPGVLSAFQGFFHV